MMVMTFAMDDEKSPQMLGTQQLNHSSTNMYILALASMPNDILQPSQTTSASCISSNGASSLPSHAARGGSELDLITDVSGEAASVGHSRGAGGSSMCFQSAQGEVRILTARMDQANKNKLPRRKCIIFLDSLDD